MHYAWETNGQVERVWPSWRHTPHFRPERPTFSDGILAPPPQGQPSVSPVILCDRGDLLGSRQVMNCLSALVVSFKCGPDKLQAIHQTSVHYSAETKFNSDNSDIGFLEINLAARVSTKCRRNPGFPPERGVSGYNYPFDGHIIVQWRGLSLSWSYNNNLVYMFDLLRSNLRDYVASLSFLSGYEINPRKSPRLYWSLNGFARTALNYTVSHLTISAFICDI